MGKVINHGGANNGWRGFFELFPEKGLGIVILTNGNNGRDLINNEFTVVTSRVFPPFPVDAQVLAAYAGRYQISEGAFVTIRVDGSRIFAQPPEAPEYELTALSDNVFSLGFVAAITFYRNEQGEVDRAVILNLGETYEAKKVP
jgi:hypothetical protein